MVYTAGEVKRPQLFVVRGALLLSALLLTAPTVAAPRVGTHDTYTRLAFDLPADMSPSALKFNVVPSEGGVTISLPAALPTESAAIDSPHVRAYRVTGGGGGSSLALSLAPGRKAKVFTLPPGGSSPARLVVDVGPDVEGVGAGQALAGAAQVIQNVKGAQTATAPVKAPPTSVVTPASTRPPARPVLRVVLDPGHGGIDPGMVGYVQEKETTLAVALRVRERLRGKGVEVIMTRDRDMHLSPDKSTDLGMRAKMANAGTVNAFVSIHVNAAASSSAQGIETWVFGRPLESRNRTLAVRENGGGNLGEQLTKEASNVAQGLLGDLLAQSNVTYSRKLANLVQGNLIRATGAVNRGVDSNIFYVIRNARTPAILIEVGFGSHPVEGRKLATDAYRDRLATAIADAIGEFLHVD